LLHYSDRQLNLVPQAEHLTHDTADKFLVLTALPTFGLRVAHTATDLEVDIEWGVVLHYGQALGEAADSELVYKVHGLAFFICLLVNGLCI
jgi:hypothetical protein